MEAVVDEGVTHLQAYFKWWIFATHPFRMWLLHVCPKQSRVICLTLYRWGRFGPPNDKPPLTLQQQPLGCWESIQNSFWLRLPSYFDWSSEHDVEILRITTAALLGQHDADSDATATPSKSVNWYQTYIYYNITRNHFMSKIFLFSCLKNEFPCNRSTADAVFLWNI